MHAPRVLVVEDEESIRHVISRVLEMNGCDMRQAGSAEEALTLLDEWEPEVALLDIVLPGKNGIQLLGEIKQIYNDTEVVMMTSNASADTALQAIRQDAYDYLQKPFGDLREVWTAVQRALEKRGLTLKNRELQKKQEERNRELSSTVSLGGPADSTCDLHSFSEILEYFVQMVTQDLDADRISVMLIHEPTGELRIAAARGISDFDTDEIRVKLGERVSGSVAGTAEPLLVANLKADRTLIEHPHPHLSDSFISVPIVLSVAIKSEPKVLGVINVTNRRSGEPFGSDDVAYLTGLAGQLAIAIDEARQSDQLRKAYESLKAAQDQLVCSERIKAVGQMAAGVAHDFNNVLGVILARTQFLLAALEQPRLDLTKMRSDLEAIRKSSLQGVEAIKRIQDYTRIRRDVVKSPVDLDAVVRDAVEISRPKWKDDSEAHGVQMHVSLDLAGVPLISGNVYELTQVVNNLIFNAVEAMPQGGRLSFRSCEDGDRVVLEVADTGTGMDEETRKRLFEPFFTTKESGQGLGTSILYGIVTRHGGEITVDSRLGEGTTFRVSLPRLAAQEEPAEVEAQDETLEPVTARVLLVDDDPMVRETYVEALEIGGHQVVPVADGNEAIARCRLESFDLVITDLSMSGMSGFEVAGEVKKLDPTLPVILFSGYAVRENDPKVLEARIDHLLPKPCLIEDLLSAVQEVVRRGVAA